MGKIAKPQLSAVFSLLSGIALLLSDIPNHSLNPSHSCLAQEAVSSSSPTTLSPLGALDSQRHRVIVSTDIGGTDPDDFQSMVHLLLYADCLEIEGLISSPYGPGRKEHILQVIDCYEKDFHNLKSYSTNYPTADSLRTITKQGAIDAAPYDGPGGATEGSSWIVQRARVADARPLYLLVWGGLEDLTQALHDAPEIATKLRVYWIGGPNKKWSANAYQYLVTHHPQIWFIEANSTYRGWFVGGDQTGRWGNAEFVKQNIAGRGSLGEFFATQLGGVIKMGDSPTVAWLLKGDPTNPMKPSWGGQFEPTRARPYAQIERFPTGDDGVEVFGILDIVVQQPNNLSKEVEATMIVENQEIAGSISHDGAVRFRFCPKDARVFNYLIRSNVAEWNGRTGQINSYSRQDGATNEPERSSSGRLLHWWTDSSQPAFSEGPHQGAKSVSQWRCEFLSDFAERMLRCQTAKR